MNYFIKLSSLFVLAILVAFNCSAGGAKKINYKTDPATGIRYFFIKHDKNGVKPAMGDIAFVRIVYKRDDDSLLFDSHSGGRTDSTSMIPLNLTSSFKGSIEQCIAMMAAGDSASFLINSDSIYLKEFKQKEVPKFVKKASSLKFYIKLVRFETLKQLKDAQYAMYENKMAEIKKTQNAEAPTIAKFLSDNNIKAKPIMIDSLYELERTGGNGKPIYEGDSVEVRYKGMLLDGTVFDQSDRGDGGKGTFKILYTHNAKLIRGWVEVLASMHEGEKVKILLPSSMAYGPYGAGKAIKPYTPLLFEIEVVKVTSPYDK
jgi:FKBP-type peptidyl-prolyl cis-trans isomerase FkpA